MDVSKHHKSVYVVAFSALILQAALAVWYTFTVIATYAKWTPGGPSCPSSSCSGSTVAGLVFYETFSFLWTSQVIGNVSLATLAGGPFGSWYYFGPRQLGEMVRICLTCSSVTHISVAKTSNLVCFWARIDTIIGVHRLWIFDRHNLGAH